MSPTVKHQNTTGPNESGIENGDAVVISGVSTVMPGSRNIMEFADKLYNKENLVKSNNSRWNFKYPELSKYNGTVPQLGCFDAQFFMVFHRLGQTMDAMTRKLLEQSYQAVFDAGICPTELSGKPVGVFVATGACESEYACIFTALTLGIVGSNRAMTANRISYYLNLKGPSMHLDGQEAGTAVALQRAYDSIISGQCEAAIVGGAKLLLHPQTSLAYHKLTPACPDGNVKCYDMKADGIALSETISVIFLQKYKDAKRVYASVRHVKTEYNIRIDENLNQTFGHYRDPEAFTKFLREFYKEAKVSPTLVGYVEGFGAADPEADKAELESFDEVFCKNRQSSLPVGSVVSNIGFTETASCITSLVKVLMAFNKGIVAANINCETPREDIKGVADGRLHILTEHADFRPAYAAVNNFSLTGLNAHVLLQGHYKPKNLEKYHSDLPRLVMASGRQESSVQKIIDDLKSSPLDVEVIALLHNIHKIRIPKHLARGFGIYSTNENNETITIKEQVDYFDDAKRPLWFVYSGMGSQWPGMAAQLMKIPVFAATIQRCHNVLKLKGIDLINIITNSDSAIFNNILHSFVGIAAIQIGLTDVLKAVGLEPDNIIGHSVGELGCAYADGCLSAEEMILSAYSRGLVSAETTLIRGSMAAVGIGYAQMIKLLPPEIQVACHNGPESCTISGPAEMMKQVVEQLTENGIFAKEVPCSNIAYHSRYIADAGPGLLKYLKEVIKKPRIRSKRWLSTSVPEERWNEPIAQHSGAEYHTNNLLNPVLFEEILKHVPYNAVLVEIAPHGLLQAILKKSLSSECKNIPLTRRGHKDNALFLLEAIGKLYMEGFDIDPSALYPKIDFPVSTHTRPLSHLVEWMYSEQYKICKYIQVIDKKKNSVYKTVLSIHDEEYEYLSGNIVDGTRQFPYAGALVLVWDLLAMSWGHPRDQVSVQFKDITFYNAPPLYDDQSLYLTVMVQRSSGRFEVTYEDNIMLAEGYVSIIAEFNDLPDVSASYDEDTEKLSRDDVYKISCEKGYQYQNGFRSIRESNMAFDCAKVNWVDNWTLFIDAVFQMNILRHNSGEISQVQHIGRVCIDTAYHMNQLANSVQNSGCIDAFYSKIHDATKCGGLFVEHIRFCDRPTSLTNEIYALKELKFVDFYEENNNDISTSLYVFLQIITENRITNNNALNALYVDDDFNNSNILETIKHFSDILTKIKLDIVPVTKTQLLQLKKDIRKLDFVLLKDVFSDKKVVEILYQILSPNTYVVNVGQIETKYPSAMYRRICVAGKGQNRIELAKWRPTQNTKITNAISVKTSSDIEHLKSKKETLIGNGKILILAPYPAPSGLKKVVQQWKRESQSLNDNIHLIMINKNYDDVAKLNIPSLDLAFNVMHDGRWGGEYYVPIQDNCKNVINNVNLKILQFGNLNSIKWIEAKKTNAQHKLIPVKVHFAGLNVFDAKRAIATISIKESSDRGFGMDFSGVTAQGDRVMGLTKNSAVSTTVNALPDLLWPVPKKWSLQDAATIPLPYCMAFYCLVFKSRLVKGMNILIHGGTGAIGQAAISICLANGCNVYTTVSNVQKKRFLQRLFPNLPADHIGNSRDRTFEEMVMRGTKGEGCHIIICCVQESLKQASLRCCATSGLTIDTVLIHTKENFNYGMFNMTKARSYTIIDFASIFEQNDPETMKLLQVLVSEGIARGYVRPLTRIVYSPQEMPRALHLLAASKHRGRVILNLEELAPFSLPRITCSPNACHMVFCGQDDFGPQWVDRLVSHGVGKVYIHCIDSLHTSSYLEYKKRCWQKLGSKIHLSFEKFTKKENVSELLKDCQQWAPIEGIFVFKTGLTNKQSIREAENLITDLDAVSKDIGLELKYFTVIQENGIGSEVCLTRAQNNLPSLSLQINDLNRDNEDNLRNLKCSSLLDCVENALQSKKPVVLAFSQLCKEDEVTVPSIKIESTNKMRNKAMEIESEEAGLNAYLKYIDSNELLANCDMIPKPTLVSTNDMYFDEFDNEKTYLCVIPGIEGLHHRFTKLCERLKLPALIVQPGYDNIDATVDELSQRLANIITRKLVIQDHFYLLGYEFGVIIAVKIAALLEKQGLVGTVYCLGGNPDDICANLKAIYTKNTEQLQNNVIEHIYSLITENKMDETEKNLLITKDWTQKVDIFTKLVRRKTVHTTEYVKAVINAIYNRICLSRDYDHRPQNLKSKVIVLQPKLSVRASIIEERYEGVIEHALNSTLASAAEDLQCTSVINKHLQPKILDDFYRKNRCENSVVHESDEFVFSFIDK